jgi:hypothetical protein
LRILQLVQLVGINLDVFFQDESGEYRHEVIYLLHSLRQVAAAPLKILYLAQSLLQENTSELEITDVDRVLQLS